MSTVTGQSKLSTSWTQSAASNIPGLNVTPLTDGDTYSFVVSTSGTTADEADLKYSNTISLSGTTAQTIDLTSLTDVYGNSVNMARVREFRVKAKSTTDGATLMIGYANAEPANQWTGFLPTGGAITVQASTATNDAWLQITAPNTTGMVTSGTSKVVQFTPSATMDIDVEIIGCSA